MWWKSPFLFRPAGGPQTSASAVCPWRSSLAPGGCLLLHLSGIRRTHTIKNHSSVSKRTLSKYTNQYVWLFGLTVNGSSLLKVFYMDFILKGNASSVGLYIKPIKSSLTVTN